MNKQSAITTGVTIACVVGLVIIIATSPNIAALPDIAKVFGYISLLTIGGGMAAFPELKNLTVEVHHWLTPHQLIHLYSVGQMAPGPNMMMVVSVGQVVAGLAGALVAAIAFFVPTAFLTWIVGRLWNKFSKNPWRPSIQRGLAPVSVGLLLAGCITIGKEVLMGDWINIAQCILVFGLLLKTKINPALMILAAAFLGAARFYVLGPVVLGK
jgi:chromate transporter